MEKRNRLTGIDLMRGVAVFGVVILHADGGIQSVPPGWSILRDFSSFAVPFFLATAFYFAVSKLYRSEQPYLFKTRAIRLLIPYLVWTFIYIAYKALKYWIASKPDKVLEIYHDPLSLLFFGRAAFHLYFLPLLITGSLLIKPLEILVRRRVSLKILSLLGALSLALYGFIWITGNSFQLSNYNAFQPAINFVFPGGAVNPVLRLLLVGLAWMIRCAPYLFVAMFLCHPSTQKTLDRVTKKNLMLLWLILFLGLHLVGSQVLPEFLYEVAQGYVALLLAIALSQQLTENRFIAALGICSFGIYLLHLLILEAFQIIGNRFFPTLVTQPSTLVLLSISVLAFFIAWLITFVLMKNKPVSWILFGV